MSQTKKHTAQFVQHIQVTDPDTGNQVGMDIYKEKGGGMIGLDSSYLENDEQPVVSPYSNGELNLL